MAWVRLDDGFFRNRKARAAGKDGRSLYVAGLCHCSSLLSDGRIEKRDIKMIAAEADVSVRVAAKLVEAGLWEDDGDGYIVPDFLEYNPTREQVKARRVSAARRKDLHSQPDLVAAVRLRDRDRCRYCNRLVNWKDRRGDGGGTYDHVDPLGSNSLTNVVVACRGCNARKKDRTPEHAGMLLLDPDLGPTQIEASLSPFPNPPDLRSSVSSSSTACQGDDDIDPKLWELVARRKLARQPPGAVRNPSAWLPKVAEDAREALAERARELLASYDVPLERLADALADGGAVPLSWAYDRRTA